MTVTVITSNGYVSKHTSHIGCPMVGAMDWIQNVLADGRPMVEHGASYYELDGRKVCEIRCEQDDE